MKLSNEQKKVLRRLYAARFADGRALRGLETRGLVMLIERADGRLSPVLTGNGVDAAERLIISGERAE